MVACNKLSALLHNISKNKPYALSGYVSNSQTHPTPCAPTIVVYISPTYKMSSTSCHVLHTSIHVSSRYMYCKTLPFYLMSTVKTTSRQTSANLCCDSQFYPSDSVILLPVQDFVISTTQGRIPPYTCSLDTEKINLKTISYNSLVKSG